MRKGLWLWLLLLLLLFLDGRHGPTMASPQMEGVMPTREDLRCCINEEQRFGNKVGLMPKGKPAREMSKCL